MVDYLVNPWNRHPHIIWYFSYAVSLVVHLNYLFSSTFRKSFSWLGNSCNPITLLPPSLLPRGSRGAQHSRYGISILFISPIQVLWIESCFEFSTLYLKNGLMKQVMKSNFRFDLIYSHLVGTLELFSSCEFKAWKKKKKIQAWAGFEPMTSAIPV